MLKEMIVLIDGELKRKFKVKTAENETTMSDVVRSFVREYTDSKT